MNKRGKKTLSTADVARMLGVAVSSVSKWIDEGKIAGGRTPGGHRRITTESLLRFLRQQKLHIPLELQASPPKVLIVDDEAPFAKWLTEELLERYPGIEVLHAGDGYAAGEMVGHSKPELVILDLRLPGIDGFEVCSRIKRNPHFKHIQVIAVTGAASKEECDRILTLGASKCLQKPFEVSVLHDLVQRILDGTSGQCH